MKYQDTLIEQPQNHNINPVIDLLLKPRNPMYQSQGDQLSLPAQFNRPSFLGRSDPYSGDSVVTLLYILALYTYTSYI